MPTVEEICNDKMKRSDEAFEDALLLFNDKRYNGSANRLYYAAFHAVAALVFMKSGQYSKTHAGLKSLFNEHFIKSKKLESRFGKIYANLFELRQEADYGDFLILDKDDIEPLIFSMKELITEIKNLIK